MPEREQRADAAKEQPIEQAIAHSMEQAIVQPIEQYTWRARVNWRPEGGATAYTRNHSFSIGQPASFKETDLQPSAVDYLLGALCGDLLTGYEALARRRGIALDALEGIVTGQLANPLVYLGVVGESGHPGFAIISVTIYVSAEATETILEGIWQTTLERSPLVNTLKRAVDLRLSLKIAY